MDKLLAGIRHFRQVAFPERKESFAQLAEGQSPNKLLITCSDSRIVPYLVTGSEPGELFVIRNAGNLVPPFGSSASGEEATIEYAVVALRIEHIVVCGHSNCGAMKGLLDPASLSGVPSVARWLGLARSTKAVVDATTPSQATPEERLRRATEINAVQQVENLKGHPSVAAAVADGKLSLHAWYYDIPSGSVTGHDPSRGEYVDVEIAEAPKLVAA